MKPDMWRPEFAQWLARKPWPVLFGVVTGFVACCLLGRQAAQLQPFEKFQRFHTGISPESHFYPTFSHVTNLATENWKPGQVLVLVGGNSILNGVGQRADQVWTKALQEQLGPQFSVVNIAMRGQYPYEFGAVVAEALAARDVPVIYITNGIQIPKFGVEWDGGVYSWMFWDAWGKGALPADSRRDAWLHAHWRRGLFEHDLQSERRLRGLVDSPTYAGDLWGLVAYRYVSTIYTRLTAPPILGARQASVDSDPGDTIPFEQRFNPGILPVELANVRGLFAGRTLETLADEKTMEVYADGHEEYLPELLRSRTLFVVRSEAPYVVRQMTADEQAIYRRFYEAETDVLRKRGLNAALVGLDYQPEDYFDRSHISEQGGRKLAADLAPQIVDLAKTLYPDSRAQAQENIP